MRFVIASAVAHGQRRQVLLLLLGQFLGILVFLLHLLPVLFLQVVDASNQSPLSAKLLEIETGAELSLVQLPEELLGNFMLLELFFYVFHFELLQKLDDVVVWVAIPYFLFLVRLGLHEFYVDVGGNDSWIFPLRKSRIVVLLSLDDLVSDGVVSQIVAEDVLELIAGDHFVTNVSEQLLADELVLDELLSDLAAALDGLVGEALLCLFVSTSH